MVDLAVTHDYLDLEVKGTHKFWALKSRLDIPLDRFVVNIERYGNTSSASIPIALDEAVRDGRIKPGQTVLMCALGAGISWGSALVRM